MTNKIIKWVSRSGWAFFVLLPIRFVIAASYYSRVPRKIFRWLITSRELTNFTYDLSTQNRTYLLAILSIITKVSYPQLDTYAKEIESDREFRKHIKRSIESKKDTVADNSHKIGRRLGWYVLVRAIKPKLVVETGVDKGLGSCVIAAALLRNSQEGKLGKYLGTDINPQAGYMFDGIYGEAGEIIFSDSIASLRKIKQKIDLFINDSDHSSNYEMREYEAIKEKLSRKAIIVGDNSHVNTELFKFSQKLGKKFIFWKEEPKDHWYPGAGMGIAF